jgi:hypothetical protein
MVIGKIVKLIWLPKNPITKERGPTPMQWKNGKGELVDYYPYEDEDGNTYVDASYDLAQFLLGEESPKWFLISPAKLSVVKRDGLGRCTYNMVDAIKLPKKGVAEINLEGAVTKQKEAGISGSSK